MKLTINGQEMPLVAKPIIKTGIKNREPENYMKILTPEQWLHKKGYTTKGTAYHKKTPKKGASKAFYDLFKEIHNGNSLYFENLINEVQEMKKEK